MTQIMWLPIPGHDGYEVSNLGEIRSIDRWVYTRRHGGLKRRRGGMRRPFAAGRGYLAVSMPQGKKYVHRLVLFAFVGEPPLDKPCACHINGNYLDNRSGNLRWGSAKDNAADSRRHSTSRTTGDRHPQSILTADIVREIRKRILPAHVWAERLGVALRTVQAARDGDNWKSVS